MSTTTNHILVVGATGTLGMPVVRALIARGYPVTGLTRSPAKVADLERLGAHGVVADALDAAALETALRAVKPATVIDLLTAIPKNGPTRAAHMQATNVLRVQGTANLLKACRTAGVGRILAESMIFAYGFGDHGERFVSESDPRQEREAQPWLQEVVDAMRSLEDQLLDANAQGQIEAIPLRYGLFYGPNSGSTLYLLGMLKRRMLPAIGGANGVTSWIHVADAVNGTVAALEKGAAGEIYNLVDDEPVNFNDFIACAAQAIGARPPIRLPLWLVQRIMPYVAEFTTARLKVSNRKAKEALGWMLQYPSYRDGLRALAV